MKTSKALQEFENSAQARDVYWIERTKLEFALALEKQLRRNGLTYAALAERIGTSPAYMSKVFRGDANLTIESMVKLSRASGAQLSITLDDERTNAKKWAWAGAVGMHSAANQPWLTGTNSFRTVQPVEEPYRVLYG